MDFLTVKLVSSVEQASPHLRIRNCLLNFLESNSRKFSVNESQCEPLLVKELLFSPFLVDKTLNLAERDITRCVEIEKKIRAASNFCMDQSYFRFLFQLTGKSKQSGLSKSERGLAKRNATKISWMHRLPNFLTHGAPLRARAPLESYAPVLAPVLCRKMIVVL